MFQGTSWQTPPPHVNTFFCLPVTITLSRCALFRLPKNWVKEFSLFFQSYIWFIETRRWRKACYSGKLCFFSWGKNSFILKKVLNIALVKLCINVVSFLINDLHSVLREKQHGVAKTMKSTSNSGWGPFGKLQDQTICK